MEKLDVPDDVKKIYEQWGGGPSADEYYEAVLAYFKGRGDVGYSEGTESEGQAKSAGDGQ